MRLHGATPANLRSKQTEMTRHVMSRNLRLCEPLHHPPASTSLQSHILAILPLVLPFVVRALDLDATVTAMANLSTALSTRRDRTERDEAEEMEDTMALMPSENVASIPIPIVQVVQLSPISRLCKFLTARAYRYRIDSFGGSLSCITVGVQCTW